MRACFVDGSSIPGAGLSQALLGHLIAGPDGYALPGLLGRLASGYVNAVTGTTPQVTVNSLTAILPTVPRLLAYNSSSTTLTLSARDATYSRRDTILLRQNGTTPTVGDEVSLMVLTGTPAASPTAPTALSTDLVLATVLVPPSGDLSVDNWQRRSGAAGATLPYWSSNPPDTTNMLRGQMLLNMTTGVLGYWDGSNIMPLSGSKSAQVTLSTTGVATGTSGVMQTSGTSTAAFTIYSATVNVNMAGSYVITANTYWTSNNTGERITTIVINGTEVARQQQGAKSLSSASVSWNGDLSAGATVQIKMYQDSGASLTSGGTLSLTRVSG